MTVAFTGHRGLKHSAVVVYLRLFRTIKKLIGEGADTFICGGAIGFDTMAAQVVLLLRKRYPIKLRIVVPCKDQDARFSAAQKQEYARILAAADEVTVLAERYYRGCMHVRNRYMVEGCNLLVSYCYDSKGGSAYTTNFALEREKPVIYL